MNLDIVSFDLESTDLNADFAVLLSAVVKPFGQPATVFRADRYNPNWSTGERMDDLAIISAIRDELAKHAIVVTHYGTGFDIPFMKAKITYHRLEPLPPIFGMDTYSVAKTAFKVSRRRLGKLAQYFGLGDKSEVEGALWLKAAMDGDLEALDAIVEHNVQDCVLLEELAMLCLPYVRSMRRI